MSNSSTVELPFCWLELLENIESTTILLSYGTHNLTIEDPDHFLRPVPLMLASAWESFHTRCVVESTSFIATFTKSSSALPKPLRKKIATEIRQNKDELASWALAEDGWRAHLQQRVQPDELVLRSGKSAQIDEYYECGIGLEKLTAKWSGSRKAVVSASAQIDVFLMKRDKIVHRSEQYLTSEECWKFRQLIVNQAIRTISVVNRYIKTHTGTEFCSASMTYLQKQLNPYEL